MRRNLLFVCAVALLLVALCPAIVSAQEPGTSDGKWSISILVGPQDSPHWVSAVEGARMAAADLNVDLTVLSPNSEGDVTLQIGQMEDRIARGDDAIIVAPLDTKAIIPAIEQANESGIIVCAVDKSAEGGDISSAVMTDNPAAAGEGAQFLINLVGEKGKILFLEGMAGHQSAVDRKAGALAVYEKYPDIELISLSGDWDTAKGQAVTEDVLTANPDIMGVQASNDMMAIGAQTALSAAGLDNVPVVGFDAVPAALEMVTDGRLAATVAQFPTRMAYIAVANAVKALEGEDVPELVDSGSAVVTTDNVGAFQRGLYGK